MSWKERGEKHAAAVAVAAAASQKFRTLFSPREKRKYSERGNKKRI